MLIYFKVFVCHETNRFIFHQIVLYCYTLMGGLGEYSPFAQSSSLSPLVDLKIINFKPCYFEAPILSHSRRAKD